MNELIKSINYFLYRDFFFILSGSIELLSIYLVFGNEIELEEIPFPSIFGNISPFIVTIFTLGIAYVIGYMTQEIFNLSPLSSSKPLKKYCKLVRSAYKRITQNEAREEYSLDDIEEAKMLIYKESDDSGMSNKIRIERLTSLKQVGTAVGSGLTISGLILFFAPEAPLFLPIIIIFFGLLLILFGWVKLIEQTDFALNYYYIHSKNKEKIQRNITTPKIIPQQD